MEKKINTEEITLDYALQLSHVTRVDLDKKKYYHILIDVKIDDKKREALNGLISDKNKLEFEENFKNTVLKQISKHRFKLFTPKK